MEQRQPSTFDLGDGAAAEPEFDPTAPDPADTKPARSPAQIAAVEKMQAGKRAALQKKKLERSGGDRNRTDQTVHATGSQEQIHDENLDMAGLEGYDVEVDSEVDEWIRPSELEAPPPRPGFVQRWIRIRLGTTRDTARLRKAQREGWRPVKASSMANSDHSLPIIRHDELGDGDYVGAEDLILMEMPSRVNDQRDRFYKRKQARQTGAVERQVKGVHREEHLGFGQIAHRNVSQVRRGQGVARAVSPADDELNI